MRRMLPALLLAAGCTSNVYSEGALKLKWTPPKGVKLETESVDGALTSAHFSGGVDVRSVAAPPPSTTGDLDALRTALLTASKLDVHGDVLVGRSGSIPNGPTVRWEMQSARDHTLLYYVPGKDRYVVISLVSPQAAFGGKSDKLELSMSSLRLE